MAICKYHNVHSSSTKVTYVLFERCCCLDVLNNFESLSGGKVFEISSILSSLVCFLLFKVNPELIHLFEEKGLKFVGHDTEGKRMEVVELDGK